MDWNRIRKKLTPGIIRKLARKARDRDRDAAFAKLSNKEAFMKIYEEGLWGASDAGGYSSGDGTRDPNLTDPYVAAVRAYCGKIGAKTAVDLGCGDFSVGSRLCDMFDRYTAIDVAENVIRQNNAKYRAKNLTFKALNITGDNLPHADVAFIRQVMQHLSNAEIAKILANIRGKYGYLIVTESMPDVGGYNPNKDMVTGPGIRIHEKSGVDIAAPPFNFEYENAETLLALKKGREVIITKSYRLE